MRPPTKRQRRQMNEAASRKNNLAQAKRLQSSLPTSIANELTEEERADKTFLRSFTQILNLLRVGKEPQVKKDVGSSLQEASASQPGLGLDDEDVKAGSIRELAFTDLPAALKQILWTGLRILVQSVSFLASGAKFATQLWWRGTFFVFKFWCFGGLKNLASAPPQPGQSELGTAGALARLGGCTAYIFGNVVLLNLLAAAVDPQFSAAYLSAAAKWVPGTIKAAANHEIIATGVWPVFQTLANLNGVVMDVYTAMIENGSVIFNVSAQILTALKTTLDFVTATLAVLSRHAGFSVGQATAATLAGVVLTSLTVRGVSLVIRAFVRAVLFIGIPFVVFVRSLIIVQGFVKKAVGKFQKGTTPNQGAFNQAVTETVQRSRVTSSPFLADAAKILAKAPTEGRPFAQATARRQAGKQGRITALDKRTTTVWYDINRQADPSRSRYDVNAIAGMNTMMDLYLAWNANKTKTSTRTLRGAVASARASLAALEIFLTQA